jgi:hypothetical protein
MNRRLVGLVLPQGRREWSLRLELELELWSIGRVV